MRWRNILWFILTLIVFCSCRTTRVVDPAAVTHDTIYQYKCFYDSIYLHDSVYQIIEQKGDTVYIEKEVYKTEYRERWHTDSIYIAKYDTIVQTIEVEKKLTNNQVVQMQIGKWLEIVLMIVIFVVVIVFLVKRIF